MSNDNQTLAFTLIPGSTFTQTYEDQGTIIHEGGTTTGVVHLTPRQAQVLKAGAPGSIFQPLVSAVVQEDAPEASSVSANTSVASFDPQAQPSTQENDAAVVAFLSKPVKEIGPALDQVHDAQFVALLHSKESGAPKPRQAVVDALNARYDALMGAK